MNADLLNLGICHLRRRAERGELASQAVLDELARLYGALVEPPPEAPADMLQTPQTYAARYLYETIHDGQAEPADP